MNPGDLVFCRMERTIQNEHKVSFQLLEVLAVDEYGQPTHVGSIGNQLDEFPRSENSLQGRSITRIEEHVPKDFHKKGGGLPYRSAVELAKGKIYSPSPEYMEVLGIIQCLKYINDTRKMSREKGE